jgi:hypothetical protein
LNASVAFDRNTFALFTTGRECASLPGVLFEPDSELKSGALHARPGQGDGQRVALTGRKPRWNALNRQTPAARVRLRVKVAGVTCFLFEAAGETRRRALGIAVRCHQPHGEDGRRQHRAHFVFCSAIRPTVFASVPNHIVRVLRSKCMWRMVPLTSMFAKNFSVFGSKPTRRLLAPVSENQIRS